MSSGLRVVLCPLSGLAGDAGVLATATALAKLVPVHIRVVHAAPDPREAIPFIGEGASGPLVEQVMSAAKRDIDIRSAASKASYDAWAKSTGFPVASAPMAAGVSIAWQEVTGAEDDQVSRLGRLADLIIVAQPSKGDPVAAAIVFEAALIDTKKPVMLAPQGADAKLSNGVALIAWNGSPEAARAVKNALPFLPKMRQVHVFSAAEKVGAIGADAIVDYLAWHGIKCEPPILTDKASANGAKLLAEAERVGAGLLVMGAYTHSRMRQLIFGGITSHVLANSKIATLMAH